MSEAGVLLRKLRSRSCLLLRQQSSACSLLLCQLLCQLCRARSLLLGRGLKLQRLSCSSTVLLLQLLCCLLLLRCSLL